MFIADGWKDYEVLDTGDGEKLERWGEIILRRPDPQAIWPKQQPDMWRRADAHYHRSTKGGGEWEFLRRLPERWQISYRDLRFYVRPTNFKHTGLFPEQAVNWDWMSGLIKQRGGARVLNLFGYTGGATVACAKAGAEVCHVDAAKGMVLWARENRELSGVDETRVRWIIDDALKFVQREKRRGKTYDGTADGSAVIWARPGRRGLEAGKRAVRPGRGMRGCIKRQAAVLPYQLVHHRLAACGAEQHAAHDGQQALRRHCGRAGGCTAGHGGRRAALRRERTLASQ